MRIFFDTEFYEDGRTIELISIGAVREDGRKFYAETTSAVSLCWKLPWLEQNVMPHLESSKMLQGTWEPVLHPPMRMALPRDIIAKDFKSFAGDKPEFWAYYADYDWVCLCQLYGTMVQLPEGWPMYCRDVKQLCDDVGNPTLPKQTTPEHHALNDALWTANAYDYLQLVRRAAR